MKKNMVNNDETDEKYVQDTSMHDLMSNYRIELFAALVHALFWSDS